MVKESKTGVFLSGGGGIGAFHIGFFKALEETGIKPDCIFGGSVGSLVGGAATYLSAEEMFEKWQVLTLESVLNIDSRKVKDFEGAKRTLMLYKECFLSCCRRDPHILIDFDNIRKLLYKTLDGDSIRKSDVDFGITTTLKPSFKRVDVWKEDMITNPLEYILASLYMPIFSHQRIINDRRYVDLCRFRHYPVELLKEKNCDQIIICNIEEQSRFGFQRTINRHLADDDVTFVSYEDTPSMLDFSTETSKRNYQNGYETTMRVLEKKRTIGK